MRAIAVILVSVLAFSPFSFATDNESSLGPLIKGPKPICKFQTTVDCKEVLPNGAECAQGIGSPRQGGKPEDCSTIQGAHSVEEAGGSWINWDEIEGPGLSRRPAIIRRPASARKSTELSQTSPGAGSLDSKSQPLHKPATRRPARKLTKLPGAGSLAQTPEDIKSSVQLNPTISEPATIAGAPLAQSARMVVASSPQMSSVKPRGNHDPASVLAIHHENLRMRVVHLRTNTSVTHGSRNVSWGPLPKAAITPPPPVQTLDESEMNIVVQLTPIHESRYHCSPLNRIGKVTRGRTRRCRASP
ncbi:hypothetical protein DXG01_011987 [Tephrocybe rancida]|nr:hypothetical protein DXG01_011987 [Tephrocybe rancida]